MSERELRDELERLSAKALTLRREHERYSHDLQVVEAVRAAKAATPALEARLVAARAALAELTRTHRIVRTEVEALREKLADARAEIARYENPGDPLGGERL